MTIVGIDEESLALAGQWPWPRSKMAELIGKIQAMDPAAVGLDVTFNEPDRLSPEALALAVPGLSEELTAQLKAMIGNDWLLGEQLGRSPTVLGMSAESTPDSSPPPRAGTVMVDDRITAHLRQYPGRQGSLEAVRRHAVEGLINGHSEGGIIRTAPLVAMVKNVPVPALSLAMWQAASGSPVLVTPAGPGLAETAVAQLRIPMQTDGTVWIWFSPRSQPIARVSAADILSGKASPELFERKMVLIGATGLGLLDYKTTPLGDFIPGVEIHAQLIEQMRDGRHLVRPAWMGLAEAALLLAGVALLFRYRTRSAGIGFAALAAGSVIIVLLFGLAAFRGAGVLVDALSPALGIALAASVFLIDRLRLSEQQRRELREQAARISGELSAAQRIQMGLLPKPQEVFAGERRVAVAALLEPARSVGGDFYDCFMLDADRLFFVVADVSGKGLPAALFMAAVKSHIKSAALASDVHLDSLLRRAQADINRENPELLFVTAFLGVLDLRTGKLSYVNAGHEPPLACRPGGPLIRLERADGPPLGALDGFEYSQGERQLSPGEWLCILTDGVTESQNVAHELFGIERTQRALNEPALPEWPGEIVKRLQLAVAAFSLGADPADDLTLLVIRWNG